MDAIEFLNSIAFEFF